MLCFSSLDISERVCDLQEFDGGAFGKIYKGILDGRQIAVKKVKAATNKAEKCFLSEVGNLIRSQSPFVMR